MLKTQKEKPPQTKYNRNENNYLKELVQPGCGGTQLSA